MDILNNLSEVEILGLTIIGEARGEPIEGQVAVGCVVRNRCLKYRKSYHDICLEPYQFSCWNADDPNYKFLVELATELINGQKLSVIAYKQCMWVAQGIEDYSIIDNVHGATYYLTQKLFSTRPKWATDAQMPMNKGNQIFFSL